MSIKHAGYWLITGALIGFGIIGILSIGFPFIILGIVLLVVGLIRMRGKEGWAALVGLGSVPALILVWDVTSAPWACASPTGGAITQRQVLHLCGHLPRAADDLPCDGSSVWSDCTGGIGVGAGARYCSAEPTCGAMSRMYQEISRAAMSVRQRAPWKWTRSTLA